MKKNILLSLLIFQLLSIVCYGSAKKLQIYLNNEPHVYDGEHKSASYLEKYPELKDTVLKGGSTPIQYYLRKRQYEFLRRTLHLHPTVDTDFLHEFLDHAQQHPTLLHSEFLDLMLISNPCLLHNVNEQTIRRCNALYTYSFGQPVCPAAYQQPVQIAHVTTEHNNSHQHDNNDSLDEMTSTEQLKRMAQIAYKNQLPQLPSHTSNTPNLTVSPSTASTQSPTSTSFGRKKTYTHNPYNFKFTHKI